MSPLPKIGEIHTGTVVRVCQTYAILIFDEGWTGLLHISEISYKFIRHFTSFVKVGSIYSVKVIDVDEAKGTVRVSLKRMESSDRRHVFAHEAVSSPEVSFKALEAALPAWIEEASQTKGNDLHDQSL